MRTQKCPRQRATSSTLAASRYLQDQSTRQARYYVVLSAAQCIRCLNPTVAQSTRVCGSTFLQRASESCMSPAVLGKQALAHPGQACTGTKRRYRPQRARPGKSSNRLARPEKAKMELPHAGLLNTCGGAPCAVPHPRPHASPGNLGTWALPACENVSQTNPKLARHRPPRHRPKRWWCQAGGTAAGLAEAAGASKDSDAEELGPSTLKGGVGVTDSIRLRVFILPLLAATLEMRTPCLPAPRGCMWHFGLHCRGDRRRAGLAAGRARSQAAQLRRD